MPRSFPRPLSRFSRRCRAGLATVLCASAIASIPTSETDAADRFVPGERVKVGVLACDIEGGLSFLIGSSRPVACRYNGVTGVEDYRGRITKIGVDVGGTGRQVLSWTVFAPATTDVFSGLEGRYAGVSANAALGPGFGTNVLLGGSGRRVVLQPVSIQTGSGLNVAATISGLRLSR